MKDKNGIPIRIGSRIKIKNQRGDVNQEGVVVFKNIHGWHNHDKVLAIKHDSGKYSSIKAWIDAIWWHNDTPENFLETLYFL